MWSVVIHLRIRYRSIQIMKTPLPKVDEIDRKWYVLDAEGQVLGRMASMIASRLRGKHRPDFTPHLDTGDFIIVVNAEKVKLTGNKREDKLYHRHTGYMGGLKTVNAAKMLETRPVDVVRLAVKRMLPKTKLGRSQLGKLKIYAGPEHPHAAQMPEQLVLGN
jgi:large subunit ribosomal protein L13